MPWLAFPIAWSRSSFQFRALRARCGSHIPAPSLPRAAIGNADGASHNGYAFEAICSHIGEELPNLCPLAGASDWIEEIDALLECKGIPTRLTGLLYGGSPVAIPEPDDYPFIGAWAASELAAAKTAFDNAELTNLDRNMAETLQQMRAWVEAAVKNPGVSIVGFLS